MSPSRKLAAAFGYPCCCRASARRRPRWFASVQAAGAPAAQEPTRSTSDFDALGFWRVSPVVHAGGPQVDRTTRYGANRDDNVLQGMVIRQTACETHNLPAFG